MFSYIFNGIYCINFRQVPGKNIFLLSWLALGLMCVGNSGYAQTSQFFSAAFNENKAVDKNVIRYTVAHYSLQGIVPENQVMNISKDPNGYYWIMTNLGYILRWNGIEFTKIDRDKNNVALPLWMYPLYSYHDNKIIFVNEGSRYYYIDNTSLLTSLDTVGKYETAGNNFNGTFCYFKKTWEEIKKSNSSGLFGLLRSSFSNINDSDLNFVWYGTGEDEFYELYRGGALYYSQGKIMQLNIAERFIYNTWAMSVANSWTIGKYFLVKNEDSFRLYKNGKLFIAGTCALLKNLNGISGNIQFSDSITYLSDNKIIYKLQVKENKLMIERYFEAPPKLVFHGFFCDEQSARIFLIMPSGGFCVCEPEYFHTIPVSRDISKNIVYSILPFRKNLMTNQNFQRRVFNGKDDYGYIAPITQIKNNFFFYPVSGKACLFDGHYNLKKSWNLQGTQIKSIVTYKGKIYMSAGKLMALDTGSLNIENVELDEPLTKNEHVAYISKGPADILYAAIDSFVYQIDLSNNTRTKLGLSALGTIRSLNYDEQLKILFATVFNKGIFCIDVSKPGYPLFRLPVEDFQQLLCCHYLLKDKDGDYWTPTNNGVFFMQKRQLIDFLNKQSKHIVYYRMGRDYGIANEEFNGGFSNGGITVGDSLYLSSMSGIVAFDPEIVKKKLLSGSRGQILEDGIVIDDSAAGNKREIRLPPDFKRCVFKFDFPFINMPSGKLEYQVSNFPDTSWIPLPQSNQILFRGVKPGNYVLTVRVQHHAEIKPVSYNIHVAKYWYQTNLAYGIYALLFLYIVFLSGNWYLYRTRNRSLREINENRRRLFSIISQDLRMPVKSYQGLADTVSFLIKKGEYHKIEKIAAQIDSTGAKLDLLLNNLINWYLLEKENISPTLKKSSLSDIVSKIIPVYANIAAEKSIHIDFSSEEEFLIYTDNTLCSLVVRNLLDNAVSNAPQNGMISFIIKRYTPDTVTMEITNSILETDTEKIKQVVKLVQHNENWEPGVKGMGLGLKLVKLAAGKISAGLMVELKDKEIKWAIALK